MSQSLPLSGETPIAAGLEFGERTTSKPARSSATWKQILRPCASLELTVLLFALSLFGMIREPGTAGRGRAVRTAGIDRCGDSIGVGQMSAMGVTTVTKVKLGLIDKISKIGVLTITETSHIIHSSNTTVAIVMVATIEPAQSE